MTSAASIGLTVMGTSGGEELVLCPWHHDTKPSAWFNPKKDVFYCAVCGLGLSAGQVASRLGVEWEFEELPDKEPEDYNLVIEQEFFDLGTAQYHPYFDKRGIDEKTFRVFNLGWKDTAPQAACLPLTRLDGTTCGVVHRYINPNEAGTRYKIFGEMQPVWPMNRLRLVKSLRETVLVTEGAWSAMRIYRTVQDMGQHVNVLALLGAKANRKIVDTMAPFNAVYLYDNDEAGTRACHKMRSLAPTKHAWTLPKAPDDMSCSEIRELLGKIDKRLMM